MPTIRVQVRGKVATNLTPEEKLVCWNEDYEVEFDFDESWAGVNFKTGLFIRNGELIAQPFDGNICAVPLIEDTTLLAVGVKSSDGRLFTTTPAFVDCLKSASDLATNKIPAPTKDVYDEIIALINKYIGQGGGGSGGSVDLRDYQKKVDDGLETQSKEIVGAINEVKGLAETAKMVFGETEGTAYEGNKGKANADNIAKLQNELSIVNIALEQSGLLKKYKQPIEQEYNERATADGANVLDGSKAVLKKVVGNTVACKNLFDKNTAIDGYEIINANDGTLGVNTEWFTTDYIHVRPNTNYVVSGKPDGSAVVAYNSNKESITNLAGGMSGFRTTENTAFVRLNGLLIQKDTFQLEEGTTATEYQPYFTGLKSASFGGIESKNADGTEIATLAFPKTEMPLGTTIDFENKKITDYGVDLVLTGTEKWAMRGQTFNDVNQFYALLLDNSNYNFGEGVCTDFDRLSSLVGTVGFAVGSMNAALYLSVDKTQFTSVDDLKAWLAQRYADGNPVKIRYVSSTLQSETDFTANNEYTAYKGGTEKVLDNDGKEYGAENTLTQDYIFVTEVK